MRKSTTNQKSSAPTHIAYQIKEHGEQGYWTRIGVAWENRDKKGINIQLDCLPLNGRITLRIAAEEQVNA